MNKISTVSVVMATYNGEKYIVEQLESLKEQTRKIDEVVIRDDCSSDQTVLMIEKFIKENKLFGWKIFVNRENKGWRKNFLELLNEATGDYIFSCDQDDIWYTDKIEKMTNKMERNSDIAVLVSDYIEQIEAGGHSSKLSHLKTKKINGCKQVCFEKQNILLKRPGCVYSVRKDFIPIVSAYFNQSENCAHDIALWGSSLIYDRLYSLEEPTIIFRRHGESSFKKELNKSQKNIEKYQYRINLLRRYNQRLQSGLSFMGNRLSAIQDYSNKKEKILQMIKENNLRISHLEKKQLVATIFSIFFYSSLLSYLADIFYILKSKK